MSKIDDIDYGIGFFFDDVEQSEEYERIDTIVSRSTRCKSTRNSRREKQKPKGINNLAKKAIILVTLGAGLAVGIYETIQVIDTTKKAGELKNSIESVVSDNTFTSRSSIEERSPYWDYDTDGMAYDVLNKNKEYDIDTRIYGCYSKLDKYNRLDCMNEIFLKMNQLISSNPGAYTEAEIEACLHNSFNEYLSSKGIALEDYAPLMEKVIRAYAKEGIEHEQRTSLLGELNGGSR